MQLLNGNERSAIYKVSYDQPYHKDTDCGGSEYVQTYTAYKAGSHKLFDGQEAELPALVSMGVATTGSHTAGINHLFPVVIDLWLICGRYEVVLKDSPMTTSIKKLESIPMTHHWSTTVGDPSINHFYSTMIDPYWPLFTIIHHSSNPWLLVLVPVARFHQIIKLNQLTISHESPLSIIVSSNVYYYGLING